MSSFIEAVIDIMEVLRKVVSWALGIKQYIVINVCIMQFFDEYVFVPLEVWINGRMFGEESGGGAGAPSFILLSALNYTKHRISLT